MQLALEWFETDRERRYRHERLGERNVRPRTQHERGEARTGSRTPRQIPTRSVRSLAPGQSHVGASAEDAVRAQRGEPRCHRQETVRSHQEEPDLRTER